MKRKIKLSVQIVIIYIALFLLTGAITGLLIVRSLDDVYRNRIYAELEAEGKTLRLIQRFSDSQDSAKNTAYIRYSSADNSYAASENLHEYIDEQSAKLLINKAFAQEQSAARYENVIDSKLIYYVILNYRGFFGVQNDDIIIVLTDTALKNRLLWETAAWLLGALLTAFAAGMLPLYLWGRALLNDINKMTAAIKAMGENHYRTSMLLERRDEIGELGVTIEEMRKKIIENELGKQKVIQGVGHDIKNPIGIIESYAAAIEDDMCEPKKAAAVILKQTKRLSERVKRLLGLTRLGYLGMSPAPAGKTDMKELLENMLGDYELLTPAQIVSNLEPAQFDGDRESWRIAVENILDNAVRYAKSRITITLCGQTLTISNDGKHIDEEYLRTIFEPYEKSRDGKFGLGLSIVAATARLYGYRALAENFEDGVRFMITR